ncbi:MAG: ATP-binding protein, partial [Planctomycetota bacterium]
MPERFEIRVPGRVRHLGTVRGCFGVLARENPELPLTEAEIGEIQLVIQEACINVTRHAHQDDFGLLEVAFV